MPARTGSKSNKDQAGVGEPDGLQVQGDAELLEQVQISVETSLGSPLDKKVALQRQLQDMAAQLAISEEGAILAALEDRMTKHTQAAISASNKELLAQLLPAMKGQAKEMETQARTVIQLRREKEALEAQLVAAVAKADDVKYEKCLPAREVASSAVDGRLRGGAERLGDRVKGAHRLLLDQGVISEDELMRLESALRLGQQVPSSSSSSFSSAPLGGLRGAGQRAAGLFGQLQEAGLVGVDGGAGPILALRRLMAKEVEKEVKAAATPSSYSDFVMGWRKMGKMTRDTLDSDPDSFWVMTWHHQSMECVYLKHGWPAAAEYHRLVIGLWEQDYLDAQSHVDSSEFRRGNVLMSTHMDSYHMAVAASKGGGSRPAGRTSGAPGALPNGGTKKKEGSDDTFCSEHQCWFPKSANHTWSWATKTGTCKLALSKK